MLFDLMMALSQQRLIVLLLKTWPYLGPNFAIPEVSIRLRDLAKNEVVEFSIRMIQLTRF